MTSSETTFNDEELIARLRAYREHDERSGGMASFEVDECIAAAARIEALTAELATCEKYRDAYAECDRIGTQAVRDLEAKLAKAEAGLLAIAKRDEQMIWGEDYEVEEAFKDMRDIALATLAEISSHNKGETQDGK